MRLSIKAKKTEELLKKINDFLSMDNELWQAVETSKEVLKYTPTNSEFQNKSFIYFYIKQLGNKNYIRGEFTVESTDKSLNYKVIGNLVGLFFTHFNEDIIRLSVLKKKGVKQKESLEF